MEEKDLKQVGEEIAKRGRGRPKGTGGNLRPDKTAQTEPGDNTIKKAVRKMHGIVENVADSMNENKVSYGTSNHLNIDTETNREKLHDMCLQYDFDFRDDILIREEIKVGNNKILI